MSLSVAAWILSDGHVSQKILRSRALARSIVGRKLTFVGVGVGVGFGVDLEVMVEMVDLDVEYELEILVLVLGMLVEGELLQRGPIQVTV